MSLEQSLENFATALNRLAAVGERFMNEVDKKQESEGPVVKPANTAARQRPAAPPVDSVEDAEFSEIGIEESDPPVDDAPPKKRGRPTGSTKKETPPATAKVDPKKEPEKKADGEKITKEKVREWMGKVQAASDAATAFKLVSKRGFKGLSEVPEDQYAAIIKEAQKLIAAAAGAEEG